MSTLHDHPIWAHRLVHLDEDGATVTYEGQYITSPCQEGAMCAVCDHAPAVTMVTVDETGRLLAICEPCLAHALTEAT